MISNNFPDSTSLGQSWLALFGTLRSAPPSLPRNSLSSFTLNMALRAAMPKTKLDPMWRKNTSLYDRENARQQVAGSPAEAGA